MLWVHLIDVLGRASAFVCLVSGRGLGPGIDHLNLADLPHAHPVIRVVTAVRPTIAYKGIAYIIRFIGLRAKAAGGF